MIRRLSLGALVAVVAVVVLGVGPAWAAYPPVVTVDSPVDNARWTGADGDDFHVRGRADTDSGNNITKVTASAAPLDQGTHSYSEFQAWEGQGASPSRAYDIQIFPDFNGKYRISAVASGVSCNILGCSPVADGPRVTRTVVLAVPPKTPEGTKAIETGGKVVIDWKSNNTEGDLLGYIVERAVPGGDYTCFTTLTVDHSVPRPATYKVNDDVKDLPSGDYKYRIRAIRALDSQSGMATCTDAGNTVSSPPSSGSKIIWKNPTQVTTTTTPPPGGVTSTTKPKAPGAGGSSGSAAAPRRPNLSALGGLGTTNNLARVPRLTESDSGFNELLPFSGAADTGEQEEGALPQTPVEVAEDSGGTTTLLFVAAGLLVTVLSMHVLWLKAQVDRMPLEPLTPEDLPAT